MNSNGPFPDTNEELEEAIARQMEHCTQREANSKKFYLVIVQACPDCYGDGALEIQDHFDGKDSAQTRRNILEEAEEAGAIFWVEEVVIQGRM